MNNLQHTLEITAVNQPAILERLLQVTRYRGFLVDGFTVHPVQNDSFLDIKLTVHDDEATVSVKENNIRKLFNQLNKLFDVNHIDLKQTSTFQCQFQGHMTEHNQSQPNFNY